MLWAVADIGSTPLAFLGGVGTSEIIVILVVALLVLGPTKLPQVAKSLGKGLRELRKATDGLKEEFYDEIQGVRGELRETRDALADVGRDALHDIPPPAEPGPARARPPVPGAVPAERPAPEAAVAAPADDQPRPPAPEAPHEESPR